LSMEISPKRGVVSAFTQQNVFEVSVVNLGNTAHTVRLQGNDPEDALAFEFEQEQLTVGPGQQREIEAVAIPTSSRVISSGRLIGFTVTGRSVDIPTVVASSQAQLEQRSILSPASLIVILLFSLIGILWYLNMPKPPTIASFTVEPEAVEMGDPVVLRWQSPDAANVQIKADGEVIAEASGRSGEYEYTTPIELGKERIVFEIVAERNDRRSAPMHDTLRLRPKEVIPDPKIESLSVDDRSIRLGDSFVLSYKFNEAVVRAILSPDNVTLDPALPNISITPKEAGSLTYTVTAYNKANKTSAKTFSVRVVDVSDAKIITFMATPNPVRAEDGRVTLTWTVMRAARVQIKANGRLLNIDETAFSGSVEVDIPSKTTYTLTAYDSNTRPTTQTLSVNVVQPPKPPPTDEPPVIPEEGVTTTTGGAGETGGSSTSGTAR
ncbi:MAG TPA: hypothetical protein VGE01_00500, partial [Fimbriimonas sp.]